LLNELHNKIGSQRLILIPSLLAGPNDTADAKKQAPRVERDEKLQGFKEMVSDARETGISELVQDWTHITIIPFGSFARLWLLLQGLAFSFPVVYSRGEIDLTPHVIDEMRKGFGTILVM
jgi:hypothetical protein